MFYEPSKGHGLPHNPFNAIIAPRPIGWISSLDREGRANLAPYSFFNAVAYEPPQVMYASTAVAGRERERGPSIKDSVRNIEETGEFVINIVTHDLRNVMNRTSAAVPGEVDEFDLAGLTKARSRMIAAPRVAESPIHLECRHTQTVRLKSADKNAPNLAVFGEVIGVHIDESVLSDGLVDYEKLRPLSRLGYRDYGLLGAVFSLGRPDE